MTYDMISYTIYDIKCSRSGNTRPKFALRFIFQYRSETVTRGARVLTQGCFFGCDNP